MDGGEVTVTVKFWADSRNDAWAQIQELACDRLDGSDTHGLNKYVVTDATYQGDRLEGAEW